MKNEKEVKGVLIADDDPITRLDIRMMLEEYGFSIAGEASDGFDAVELCRASRPDIVLMDIEMPVFDGLGAAEQILKEGLSGCIVIISAFFEDDFVKRAMQMGVTGYVTKPVESCRLLPAIEVAFAQSQRLKKVQQQVEDNEKQIARMRLIEQAKMILADEKHISGKEAYREIQKLAMDKRCSMEVIARMLISKSNGRNVVNEAKELLMKKYGFSEQTAYRKIRKIAEQQSVDMEKVARALLAKEKGIY